MTHVLIRGTRYVATVQPGVGADRTAVRRPRYRRRILVQQIVRALDEDVRGDAIVDREVECVVGVNRQRDGHRRAADVVTSRGCPCLDALRHALELVLYQGRPHGTSAVTRKLLFLWGHVMRGRRRQRAGCTDWRRRHSNQDTTQRDDPGQRAQPGRALSRSAHRKPPVAVGPRPHSLTKTASRPQRRRRTAPLNLVQLACGFATRSTGTWRPNVGSRVITFRLLSPSLHGRDAIVNRFYTNVTSFIRLPQQAPAPERSGQGVRVRHGPTLTVRTG